MRIVTSVPGPILLRSELRLLYSCTQCRPMSHGAGYFLLRGTMAPGNQFTYLEQRLHASSADVCTRCRAARGSATSYTVGTSCHSIFQCSVQHGTGRYSRMETIEQCARQCLVEEELVASSQGRFTTPSHESLSQEFVPVSWTTIHRRGGLTRTTAPVVTILTSGQGRPRTG